MKLLGVIVAALLLSALGPFQVAASPLLNFAASFTAQSRHRFSGKMGIYFAPAFFLLRFGL